MPDFIALQQLQVVVTQEIAAFGAFGALSTVAMFLLGFRAVRSIFGLARSKMTRASADLDQLIDVTDAARSRRMRGRLLYVAVVTVTFCFLATAALGLFVGARDGAPSWARLVLLAVVLGPALILPALRWRRRRRLGIGQAPGGAGRVILTAGAWFMTAVALFLAMSFIYFGIVTIAEGPDLIAMEEAGLNTAPLIENPDLGNAFAVLGMLAGVIILAFTPLFVRLSRRIARANAAAVRKADTRPPVLMLRGFRDDRRRIPAITSSRRPLIELIWPTTRDRWETVLAWEADQIGPPIALAKPGSIGRPLGAARERAPVTGDEWLQIIRDWIDESKAVLWSLDATDGVVRELVELRDRNALDRTVVVLPPVGRSELRDRWSRAVEISGGVLGPLPADPASTLCAFSRDGMLIAVTATRRDEASYGAALNAAFEAINPST